MEEQKFGEIFLYTTPDGSVKIEILLEGETFWLYQKKMAELFGTTRENITSHLKSVFSAGELHEESVCNDFLHTAADGKNYKTKFYNLMRKWKNLETDI